jgi:hypothetical protein
VSGTVADAGEDRPMRAGRVFTWLRGKRWDGWIETIAVLLLATASLAAAWSGYQASLWSGEQSMLYSQASARRVLSTEASTNAYMYTIMDIEAFNLYALAYDQGNTALMEFHERQFSDRLRPAVEAWVATDPLNDPSAPGSPFEMPEYVVPERERAAALSKEAETLFEQGVHANERSDDYVLNTVYFATVLFFAGIVTKVRGRPARTLMVVLGAALFAFGLFHVVTLPVE